MEMVLINYFIFFFCAVGIFAAFYFIGSALSDCRQRGYEKLVTVVFLDPDLTGAQSRLLCLISDIRRGLPSFKKGRILAVDPGIDPTVSAMLEKMADDYDFLFVAARNDYLDILKLLLEN